MVCATTSIAYPKGHVFASRPTCVRYVVMTLSFQNFLHSSLWPRDLWPLMWPCHIMWLICDSMIVMLHLTLTLSSKWKNKLKWKWKWNIKWKSQCPGFTCLTKVSKQFSKKIIVNISNKKSKKIPTFKPIDFSNISFSLVFPRLFKEELNKLKHHGKSQNIQEPFW